MFTNLAILGAPPCVYIYIDIDIPCINLTASHLPRCPFSSYSASSSFDFSGSPHWPHHPESDVSPWKSCGPRCLFQWIGLREHLQETNGNQWKPRIFPWNMFFFRKLSLKPIHWLFRFAPKKTKAPHFHFLSANSKKHSESLRDIQGFAKPSIVSIGGYRGYRGLPFLRATIPPRSCISVSLVRRQTPLRPGELGEGRAWAVRCFWWFMGDKMAEMRMISRVIGRFQGF